MRKEFQLEMTHPLNENPMKMLLILSWEVETEAITYVNVNTPHYK